MVTVAAAARLPFPVLVGDIGGTNARFALVGGRDAPLETFRSVATADFPTIEDAIEASVIRNSPVRPRSAIIDLAGPITGDEVPLTNADWVIRPRDVMARLGIEHVVLLNDFEALALALTALSGDDLVAIGGGAAAPGAKVVLGPGTGLGVGALIEAGGLWVPVPGEGGHVSLGPDEPDEFPLWESIELEHGRISGETILCGRGLVRLYRAVAKTQKSEPLLNTPAKVTKAALDRSDAVAAKTVLLWTRLLGRLAGDMALVFMARGGAYIGGGIAPRILPFMSSGEFRRAFEKKAPHEALMAGIQCSLIVGENPAMHGLAAFARTPDRFGVNLAGRHWSR